ncbi:MAG: tetratricopeptide repeat protein, partial [Bacteroidota bacterium]
MRKKHWLRFFLALSSVGLVTRTVWSQSIPDSLSPDSSTIELEQAHSEHLIDLCYQYLRTAPDSLPIYAQKAFVHSQTINYQEGMAKAYILNGIVAEWETDFSKALMLHRHSEKIADRLGNASLLGNAKLSLGRTFMQIHHNDSAQVVLMEALPLFAKAKEERRLGMTYGELGKVSHNLGDYYKAISYFHKAKEIFLQHSGGKEGVNIGIVYSNIGAAYSEMEEWVLAIPQIKKALSIFETHQYQKAIGNELNNLGTCSIGLREYEKALDYLERSLAIKLKIGLKNQIGITQMTICKLYANLGQTAKATDFCQKALTNFDLAERPTFKTQTHLTLADIHVKKKEYTDAENQYQKALETSLKFGSETELEEVMAAMSVFQEEAQDKMIAPAARDSIADQWLAILYEADNNVEWFQTAHQLIDYYIKKKEVHKALVQIHTALELAARENNVRYRFKIQSQFGQVYELIEHAYERAIRSYDLALGIVSDTIAPIEYAKIIYAKGRCYFRLSRYNETLDIGYNLLAMESDTTLDWSRLRASAHNLLGVVYKNRGQLDSAIHQATLAAEIAKKINYNQHLIYSNIANMYMIQGFYDKALIYNTKALERIMTQEDLAFEATVLANRGNIYVYLYEREESLRFYKKSLAIREENKVGLSQTCYNHHGIALNLIALNQLGEAWVHLNEGLKLAKQYKNRIVEMDMNLLFGNYYNAKEDHDLAIPYFQKALKAAEQLDNNTNFIDASIELGSIFTKEQQPRKALSYLNRSLPALQVTSSIDLEQKVYDLMTQAYHQLGNEQEELNWLKKLMEVKDSINQKVNQKQIAELTAQQDLLRKEKEIRTLRENELAQSMALSKSQGEKLLFGIGLIFLFFTGLFFYYRARVRQRSNKLLTQKNRVIGLQNTKLQTNQERLKQSLEEKEVLLKEIHHRVKNNLQLIISLLNMQARNGQSKSIDDFLQDGKTRIKSIALIHEQLYQSEQLDAIRFDIYTHELVQKICAFHEKEAHQVNCQFFLDEVLLSIDKAIPLGLILNELVSNSFKHAFKDETNLHFSNTPATDLL